MSLATQSSMQISKLATPTLIFFAMNPIVKTFAILFSGASTLLVIHLFDHQEVFLESRESKTVNGRPVFNKIKWFQFKDKDVWMMNQSHHGLDNSASPETAKSWDRLAIVVDKTHYPKRARFYQLEPGALEWQEDLAEKPFRVSCFLCHNNGPRNIRPDYDSPSNPTTLEDRFKIAYWNFRMNSYGRVVADSIHNQRDQTTTPPFRFRGAYENEHLNIAACVKCHKDSGFRARGFLTRQQVSTIKFMVESQQMPPLGSWLSNQEKQELEVFLQGF